MSVIVIGSGPNGLVTAFYLARAGLRPLVLEARDQVGGGAVTEEFHPGFRAPTLAHEMDPLPAVVARDMQLERHGLEVIHTTRPVVALNGDDEALVLDEDAGTTRQAVARHSVRDAESLARFLDAMQSIGAALGEWLERPPPSIDRPSRADLWRLLRTGARVRRLPRRDMYRLFRYVPMAIADLVAEWFERDLLRAVVAAPALVGEMAGPWSAGTGALLLLRAASRDRLTVAGPQFRGSVGALTRAMAAAARAAGAEIRTSARVARIQIADGTVTGVALENGGEIAATTVVSSADPRRTFLGLVDAAHLDPGFVDKISNYRNRGVLAKLNLALDAVPAIPGLRPLPAERRARALGGRLHIGPGIDYLERAFDATKYGTWSEAPCLSATMPSVDDPGLAPAGKHVMSIYAQYAPYGLRGRSWDDDARASFQDAVVRTLSEHMPDIRGLIRHVQLVTPQDLERSGGPTGGQIFHGDLALDQLFVMRPVMGWAGYRTPVAGLYLCGSGTHPGRGPTGASGANASRVILEDLR
jgi:phytoene dehydrogenase-like protein